MGVGVGGAFLMLVLFRIFGSNNDFVYVNNYIIKEMNWIVCMCGPKNNGILRKIDNIVRVNL